MNVLAGTNNGIFLTSDNGSNWVQFNNGLTDTTVTSVAVSDKYIYAGTSEGVFATNKNNFVWSQINNSLANVYINSLEVVDTMIFAGTPNGVFLSTNNASSWNEINDGFNNNAVFAFVVSPDGANDSIIFAGTHSSGVWKRPLSSIYTSVKTISGKFPVLFNLEQNYPNPFNPSTIISYSIPKAGNVRLTIFNSLGQKVADLVDKYQQAGKHNVEFDPKNISSGIYYYSLAAGNHEKTRKMILLK